MAAFRLRGHGGGVLRNGTHLGEARPGGGQFARAVPRGHVRARAALPGGRASLRVRPRGGDDPHRPRSRAQQVVPLHRPRTPLGRLGGPGARGRVARWAGCRAQAPTARDRRSDEPRPACLQCHREASDAHQGGSTGQYRRDDPRPPSGDQPGTEHGARGPQTGSVPGEPARVRRQLERDRSGGDLGLLRPAHDLHGAGRRRSHGRLRGA